MTTLDSPIAAVLGKVTPAKRKKFEDGLGLRTVGDLLRHFPRRYLETGSLTKVHDLKIGQLALRRRRDHRVQGAHLQGPPHRPAGLPRRSGAQHRRPQAEDDVLREEQAHVRLAREPGRDRSPRGLPGTGRPVPGHVAADQPGDDDLRPRRRGGEHRRPDRRALPDLPAHQGRRDVGRQPCRAGGAWPGDGAPRAAARRRPGGVRRARRAHGSRLDPRAGPARPGRPRAAPVPVRGGPGHPARPRPPSADAPRAGRDREDRRRRGAPAGVRRAAAVHPHRRPARDRRADRPRPRPATPDEPPAPGRGRLRQDPRRAAGDAARGRLWRAGRAARADRGARAAALPLDRDHAGRAR